MIIEINFEISLSNQKRTIAVQIRNGTVDSAPNINSFLSVKRQNKNKNRKFAQETMPVLHKTTSSDERSHHHGRSDITLRQEDKIRKRLEVSWTLNNQSTYLPSNTFDSNLRSTCHNHSPSFDPSAPPSQHLSPTQQIFTLFEQLLF